MTDWHNCNGTIGRVLQWLTPEEPGPAPFWALPVFDVEGPAILKVAYCPVCGEKLEPPETEQE